MSLLDSLSGTASNLLSSAKTALGVPADHTKSLDKEIVIESLHIHPIKSCAGSSVKQARITPSGLQYDRTWLIIDAKELKFCTARGSPHMVTIRPVIDTEKGLLVIHVPSKQEGGEEKVVSTPLDPTEEQLKSYEFLSDIEIWIHKVDGYAVSPDADAALSEYMGKPVRLVRKGPAIRPGGGDDPRGEGSRVNFQDFHSLTVASAASMDNVRRTLLASVYPEGAQQGKGEGVEARKVPENLSRDFWTPERLRSLAIERFRINVIVASPAIAPQPVEAWEEDAWTHLEVFEQGTTPPVGAAAHGKGVGIDCNARCGRCLVPSVDPETGKRDPHIPYRVLQEYRQVQPEMKPGGKPCFGVLSSPSQDDGLIKVGDIIRVTATTDPATRTITMPAKK